MNRRLALWTAIVATVIARGASAQEVTIGYQGLPYKMSGETNTGIQVAEGVLLHVGAGAEAGYDSNVFYSNTAEVSSPIIRTSLFGEMTNATRTGATTRMTFDLRAGVTYRRYQSDDVVSTNGQDFKNAWMPTAGVALSAGGGQFGFGIADTFARLEDPPYDQSQGPITRYNNQASAEGRWAPGGGRLTGTLRYTNMLDIFQGFYDYASADYNYFMLDAAWKWLPKTAIFVNVQQGYVFYLNDTQATMNNKGSSYPLQATAGLRGLLTEKTSALLQLGYTNGFYSGGSTGGFLGSTYAEASLSVRPTMLSRVVLGFRHDFTNAVIAAFSYNESVYASYVQQIANRLALDLSGRYVHRNYGGAFVDPGQMATGRTDDFFQGGVTLDYFMRNWAYVGVAYSVLSNSSNIPTVEYLKQQMFVRVGVTY
jgi:hypothetical protein